MRQKTPYGARVISSITRLQDHRVQIAWKNFERTCTPGSPDSVIARPNSQGEHDDLEHVAIGHRTDRIRRKQIDEHIRERRSLLRFERSVGVELESSTRLNDRGSDQRQRHRDRGGHQIETQRLRAHPTELRDVVQGCGTADQGNEDQRNDQELQAGQKNRAAHVEQPIHHDGLDPAGDPDPVEQQADGEPRCHSEHDLERQAAAHAPIGLHRTPLMDWRKHTPAGESGLSAGRGGAEAWKALPPAR